jgi:hypothetical protein
LKEWLSKSQTKNKCNRKIMVNSLDIFIVVFKKKSYTNEPLSKVHHTLNEKK